MFRPLMLTILRLYMDLSSSYTTDTTYMCGVCLGVVKGFVWVRDRVCVSCRCIMWNSITSLFMPYL